MSIFVSAIIQAKEGHAADLRPFLLDLVNESRAQKACLQYDLHQSVDNENIFIINEEWVEQFWLDLNDQQDYIDQFREASKALIEQQIVHRSEKIF